MNLKTELAIKGILACWCKDLDYSGKRFEAIVKLRRLHKKHQRICTDQCNGKFKTEESYHKAISKVEDKMQQIIMADVSLSRLSIEHQYDPRGITTHLFYNNKYERDGHTEDCKYNITDALFI